MDTDTDSGRPWYRTLFRPFDYLYAFVAGTFSETLDDFSAGARTGLWLAPLITLVGMYTGAVTFGIGPLLMAAVLGVSGGAVLGGGFGLITGGIREMWHEWQSPGPDAPEPDTETPARAAQVAARRDTRRAYVQAYRKAQGEQNVKIDRLRQQITEEERDVKMYYGTHSGNSWQDRVAANAPVLAEKAPLPHAPHLIAESSPALWQDRTTAEPLAGAGPARGS